MPYDYADDLLHFSSVLCCLRLVSYFIGKEGLQGMKQLTDDVQKLVHIPLFALSLPYDIVGKITLRKNQHKRTIPQTTQFKNYYILMSYTMLNLTHNR